MRFGAIKAELTINRDVQVREFHSKGEIYKTLFLNKPLDVKMHFLGPRFERQFNGGTQGQFQRYCCEDGQIWRL